MYLIDRVQVKNPSHTHMCYLIGEGAVRYVRPTMNKWTSMKVSGEQFSIEAGKVILSSSILEATNVQQFQQQQREIIHEGGTTVVVAPYLKKNERIDEVMRRTNHQLINSTIDYMIALTISIEQLQPVLLRKCRHHQISLLKVDIHSLESLSHVPWFQVADTLISYQTVLVPIILEKNERVRQQILELWKSLCRQYHIKFTTDVVEEKPLSKQNLQLIGIFPQKGTLQVGSDADYLLIDNNSSIDEKNKKKLPNIVSIRGISIKVEEVITLKPGFGLRIQVNIPGRFIALPSYDGV